MRGDYYAHLDYFAARGIAMPTAKIKAPGLASELAIHSQMRRGGATAPGTPALQRCPADTATLFSPVRADQGNLDRLM